MSNDETYNSSLRFIFKQLDLYVENNKQSNNNKGNKGSSKPKVERLPVLKG